MDLNEKNNDFAESRDESVSVRKEELAAAFQELAVFIKNAFTDAHMHSSWSVYYAPGEWNDKKIKRGHVRIKLRVDMTLCDDNELIPIECIPHNFCSEKEYVFELRNITKAERYVFMKMLVTFCNKNKVYFYNSVLKRKYWTTDIMENPTVESIIEAEKRERYLSDNHSLYQVRPSMFRANCIYAKLIRFIK